MLRPNGHLVIAVPSDRVAVEWKHYRHYGVPAFRRLFAGMFGDLEVIGLCPYFPTMRLWQRIPLVGRLLDGRIRTCAPEVGRTLVGIARKLPA